MVSGGCLRPPGYCQGGINVNPSDKSSSSVIFLSHGLFSQWPLTGLKCQASPNRKVAMAGGYFRDRA